MKTFHINFSKQKIKATLATLCLGSLATTALSEDRGQGDVPQRTVYVCKSPLQPVAVKIQGKGARLTGKIFQEGELVSVQEVALELSTDEENQVDRLIFRAGSVLDGGFNLRVFINHPAEEIEHQGHVTFRSAFDDRVKNTRLTCLHR